MFYDGVFVRQARMNWNSVFYPARKEPVLFMSFIICLNATVHWLQLFITYLIQVKVLTYWNPFPVVLSVFRFRFDVLCAVGWKPLDQSLTRLVLHLPWWHGGLIALFSSLHYYWVFCPVPTISLLFVALFWGKKVKTNKTCINFQCKPVLKRGAGLYRWQN